MKSIEAKLNWTAKNFKPMPNPINNKTEGIFTFLANTSNMYETMMIEQIKIRIPFWVMFYWKINSAKIGKSWEFGDGRIKELVK